MKKFVPLAAAIAASLAGSAAFALAPADDSVAANYDVRLVLSGASAFQTALENELSKVGSSICNNPAVATATYNKYQANANGSPGLFAYSCNLQPNVVSAGGGEKALIYYRNEGGSIYGVTSIARPSTQPLRLVVNGSCSTPAAGATGNCTVTGYAAVADTVTGGNATAATTQLGLSDVEPKQFAGENYPDAATASKLQPALSGSELNTLTSASTAMIGQVFGVYVNTANSELASLTSLSKSSISAIFQGLYSDWNQVPRNDGSNTPVTTSSLPILVCKRESGSGTQVATSVFFNNKGCGADYAFATEAVPGNVLVKENNTTGLQRTCVTTTTGTIATGPNAGTYSGVGAIGVVVAEADTAGRKLIKIDGQGTLGTTIGNLAPLAAAGDYPFWFEATANKGSAFTAAPAATQTLGNKLIGFLQKKATTATSPSVLALPAFNTASYPLAAGVPPIAIGTRSKNSCSSQQNQN